MTRYHPRCEHKHPHTGNRCRLDIGHKGPCAWWNRTGYREEWGKVEVEE